MSCETLFPKAGITDGELLAEVRRLAGCEREATARLVAHLGELEARRLFLAEGFPSLFAYCTEVLHFSEDAACNRIEAARLVRRFPVVLPLLQDGRLSLTTLRLLGPQLGSDDPAELLAAASWKSRREVEVLIARRAPKALVPPSIRKLPEPRTMPGAALAELQRPAPAPAAHPSRRAALAPLSEDQFKVTFTARAETCRKLKLAQDLLRHQIPDGSPAEIFDRALSVLLEELARRKAAACSRPRPSAGSRLGSRHIPAEVRRAVWLRDGGRCAFVARSGRRCGEGGFLEFHHRKPYAEGGEATAENISLRCRPHNGYEADLLFSMREPVRDEPGIRSGTDRRTRVPDLSGRSPGRHAPMNRLRVPDVS
jgi:hypothetical protein